MKPAQEALSGADRAQRREDEYLRHLEREGRTAVNDHPEGCFYCGSLWHHSDGCTDAVAVREYWGGDE